MDPLSVFAAPSSFIAVASALEKLIGKSVKYAKTMAYAAEVVKSLSREASHFSTALGMIQATQIGLPQDVNDFVIRFKAEETYLTSAQRIVQ